MFVCGIEHMTYELQSGGIIEARLEAGVRP